MLRVNYNLHVDNMYKYVIATSYGQYNTADKQEDIIKMAEALINESTKICPQINTLASSFFNTCALFGLSFDELYNKYIGKNVLNKFRQENGYKEGTYVKYWDGEEDNKVILKIIEENQNLTSDEMFSRLHLLYAGTRGVGSCAQGEYK